MPCALASAQEIFPSPLSSYKASESVSGVAVATGVASGVPSGVGVVAGSAVGVGVGVGCSVSGSTTTISNRRAFRQHRFKDVHFGLVYRKGILGTYLDNAIGKPALVDFRQPLSGVFSDLFISVSNQDPPA